MKDEQLAFPSQHHRGVGLTKREYFAAKIAAGLVMRGYPIGDTKTDKYSLVKHAYEFADALLEFEDADCIWLNPDVWMHSKYWNEPCTCGKHIGMYIGFDSKTKKDGYIKG